MHVDDVGVKKPYEPPRLRRLEQAEVDARNLRALLSTPATEREREQREVDGDRRDDDPPA